MSGWSGGTATNKEQQDNHNYPVTTLTQLFHEGSLLHSRNGKLNSLDNDNLVSSLSTGDFDFKVVVGLVVNGVSLPHNFIPGSR